MLKAKTTGFWISISGAIVIIVQAVAEIFGFSISSEIISDVVFYICSGLVMLGILIPTNKQGEVITEEEFNNSKDELFEDSLATNDEDTPKTT